MIAKSASIARQSSVGSSLFNSINCFQYATKP